MIQMKELTLNKHYVMNISENYMIWSNRNYSRAVCKIINFIIKLKKFYPKFQSINKIQSQKKRNRRRRT
jgi:hypothetical protein